MLRNVVWTFACALCFGLLLSAAEEPKYAANGQLVFPDHYREWIFLSSGLGMSYGPLSASARTGEPVFDNVFVSPFAYRAFLESGKWPENTMFVLEIRNSRSKESINQGGHFQADVAGVEAEVKKDGRWTFFNSQGKPFDNKAGCNACHSANGASDNTFVQFYPTLLPVAREKGTLRQQ